MSAAVNGSAYVFKTENLTRRFSGFVAAFRRVFSRRARVETEMKEEIPPLDEPAAPETVA